MTLLPAAHLGPDMNFPAQPTLGPWGRALHDAIARHDVEGAAWALGRGADVHALAPVVLTEHDNGQREADGGYTALHLAVVSLLEGSRGEVATVSMPLLRLLLEAGADPNAPTAAFPDVLQPLEALIVAQPANLVEACVLLREHGARPTVRAVDLAVEALVPESAAVLTVLFADLSLAERAALLHGQALAQVTRSPLGVEGWACVRELVRQGGNLDKPVRTVTGTRLPTPAQAIAHHHGEAALASLGHRSVTPRRRRP